jgi:putative transposase
VIAEGMDMAGKRSTPEQVVAEPRQVAVLTAQGKAVAEAVRAIGISGPRCCRWRAECGGLEPGRLGRLKRLKRLGRLKRLKRLKRLGAENARLRKAVADLALGKAILKGRAHCAWRPGRLLSAARRRRVRGGHATATPGVSGRLACGVPGQHRSTRRKAPGVPGDEAAPREGAVALARLPGRHGYRRVTALPRVAGWCANRGRVERIRRREGPKAPPRQPKRGRPWPGDGSRARLRPERRSRVRAHDLVEDRTRGGRRFRMPRVADEFARGALAVRVARRLGSAEAIDALAGLPIARGVRPRASVRATAPRSWPRRRRAGPPASAPGPPVSSPAAPGRTAAWRASTAGPGMSCWTARCPARSGAEPQGGSAGCRSSRGACTAAPHGRTAHSATARPRRGWSCRACHCRLAARLRPAQRTRPQPCSPNPLPGPREGGWSLAEFRLRRPHIAPQSGERALNVTPLLAAASVSDRPH